MTRVMKHLVGAIVAVLILAAPAQAVQFDYQGRVPDENGHKNKTYCVNGGDSPTSCRAVQFKNAKKRTADGCKRGLSRRGRMGYFPKVFHPRTKWKRTGVLDCRD